MSESESLADWLATEHPKVVSACRELLAALEASEPQAAKYPSMALAVLERIGDPPTASRAVAGLQRAMDAELRHPPAGLSGDGSVHEVYRLVSVACVGQRVDERRWDWQRSKGQTRLPNLDDVVLAYQAVIALIEARLASLEPKNG